MASRSSFRRGAFAFFSALGGGGAALVFFAVKDFGLARASAEWPRTEAVVLSGAGPLRYAYTIEGRNYQGRRVRFLTATLGAPPFARPKPGAAFKIAVHPRDPTVSVAAPGGGALLFAAFVTLGGLGAFVGAAGMLRSATAVEETSGEGRVD